MTKKEKLFDRLKNNPKDVNFGDIRVLLDSEGFALERITGSHHVFKKGKIIFVVPVHNKKVKTVYIKRLIEIIEESRSQN